jgi:tRNA (guanine26-N2/guanine27-N2)-dimethyltransferase
MSQPASNSAKDVPAGYKVLKEGQANILYKEKRLEIDENQMIKTQKGKRKANEQNEVRGTVFYNPVQEFNRDISILTIREYARLKEEEMKVRGKHEFTGINILEALSATGLRSVRYMKEIEALKTLVANDIDPTATELMRKNFEFNKCPEEKFKSKILFIGL